MVRIYLTHCSKEKDSTFKAPGKTATPDELYTDPEIQKFMIRCKETGVCWAILSDLYGVYQSDERYGWYEKHPDTVTQHEEDKIVQQFDRKLSRYDEIWFYIRAESFHRFYARVLKRTVLADGVRIFNDLDSVKQNDVAFEV